MIGGRIFWITVAASLLSYPLVIDRFLADNLFRISGILALLRAGLKPLGA